jgi:5-oxoprolinase (ATP-hydrolysing) subunit A
MNLPLPKINCDLGEGVKNEEFILKWVDAASVACGGHFGDLHTIQNTLALAKKADKKVGAHPSYPDQLNFGRKTMAISISQLLESIRSQISLFLDVSQNLEMKMDHIKFHGALYNDAAENASLAASLVDFLRSEYPEIPVFVPPNSEMEKAAIAKKQPIRREIFGDRAYENNYRLVSRSHPDSLFTEVEVVENHLAFILNSGILLSKNRRELPVQADTICFHGDNPGIHDFLPHIRKKYWI